MRSAETHSETGIHIERIETKELRLGIVLVLSSYLMPLLFNVQNFGVLHSLYIALSQREKTELMVAALQLVALNAIRGIPHYVGAFFIGESVRFRWRRRSVWVVNALLIVLILQCTYWGIAAVHDIHYDFGVPAVLVSCFVLIFSKLGYQRISLLKKAQLIVLFLAAFQFLDVMPAMQAFPVGRGEISWDVKLAAAVLEGGTMLNAMALVGSLIFLLFGLLSFFQLRDENNLRELSALKEQNESIRVQAQLNEIKNRTYQEMQNLVHDLKSPLTAVQTLVGVVKMKCELEQRDQDAEYLTRVEGAVEQMSSMISEILYQDRCSPVTTEAVVSVALAQSSVTEYAPCLHADNQAPGALIRANRVLFPRALVNLLQNSWQAVPKGREAAIWLRVALRPETGRVVFTVSDNGTGIGEAQRDTMWDRGVSGRESSGLGLAFVRSVVDGMDGYITVESAPGEGTSISIILPQEGAEE